MVYSELAVVTPRHGINAVRFVKLILILRFLLCFQILHEITAPTIGLWVGVIRQVYFVLIAVNKEASCFSLPFIINFGHWDNSHLVSLSQDLLLGKLAGVTGHQLS